MERAHAGRSGNQRPTEVAKAVMYTYAKRAIVGMSIIATTTLNSSLSAVSQSPFGIVLAPRPPDANRGLPARNAWDIGTAP
jgi:hypothetical protein